MELRKGAAGMNLSTLAVLLSRNTDRLAQLESVGVCFAEIENLADEIERVINRAVPPRVLGPCTNQVGSMHDKHCQKHHPHRCDIALTAKPEDTTVVCPHCGAQHDVERLIDAQMREADDMSFTISELYKTYLPAVRIYIPLRTLQHWAASSRLVPTGYTAEGDPRFMLAHIRLLHAARPQNSATGAAAHRKTA
jgi:hypothetical protein